MTRLELIAQTSRTVADTSSRLGKTRTLAAALSQVDAAEIAIAIAYLSGETCQGKLGVSHASLRDAQAAPAAEAALTLAHVDRLFAEVVAIKGKGASAKRTERLRTLFSRATEEEQDFLVRLIVGELRQGSLKGIMLEAIAAAAQLPAQDVRTRAIIQQMSADEERHGRNAMLAGGAQLPKPVRALMKLTAKVMTRTAYWV